VIRVLMICNLGISTSFVKDRIINAFSQREKELDFIAQPRSDLDQLIDDVDLVLIAPQIAYLKDEVFQICEEHHKKCLVIPFTLYGNMDGEGIANLIEETVSKDQ
jgi:PTS system cellobiose-specific IIB component